MRYGRIAKAAGRHQLQIFGGFHPTRDENAPPGCKTLLLLGPKEFGFWPMFRETPEFTDGGPDAMDRWSTRVLGDLANDLGATALFPFGGPPYQPFIAWALRTGRVWQSPAGLLVHDRAGLMVSFRGALAFAQTIPLPAPAQSPCLTCQGQPCLTACPVGALSADSGYATAACHAFLDSGPGQGCMTKGCAARRACPLSQSSGRTEEQSAYHMRHFHR